MLFFFSFRITQDKYANNKMASNSVVIVYAVSFVIKCSNLFEILFPSCVPVSSLDFNPYTTLCHHISCTQTKTNVPNHCQEM